MIPSLRRVRGPKCCTCISRESLESERRRPSAGEQGDSSGRREWERDGISALPNESVEENMKEDHKE